MDALIRRLRPDLAIDRPSDDRGGFVRQESSTALDRTPPEWPYSASANTKWVVSSLPRTVSSNSSVDFVDYPVRHVSVSPDRQRLRLAQALANGGGLDHYVIGRLDDRADRSALVAVRDVFRFHAAHEEDYRDLRSCAQIALLTGRHGSTDEFRGWFRVLAEHHFLFDTLLIDRASGVPPVALRRADPARPRADLRRRGGVDRPLRRGRRDLVATGRTGVARRGAGTPGSAGARLPRDRAHPRGRATTCVARTSRSMTTPTSLVSPTRDLLFLDGVYVDAEYRPGAAACCG